LSEAAGWLAALHESGNGLRVADADPLRRLDQIKAALAAPKAPDMRAVAGQAPHAERAAPPAAGTRLSARPATRDALV